MEHGVKRYGCHEFVAVFNSIWRGHELFKTSWNSLPHLRQIHCLTETNISIHNAKFNADVSVVYKSIESSSSLDFEWVSSRWTSGVICHWKLHRFSLSGFIFNKRNNYCSGWFINLPVRSMCKQTDSWKARNLNFQADIGFPKPQQTIFRNPGIIQKRSVIPVLWNWITFYPTKENFYRN